MSDQYGYVYETTNKVNGRRYVGQKKGDFNHSYLGSGFLLRKAVDKYGIGSFAVKVLATAENKAKLDELERVYIAEYRRIFGKEKLYNIADGAHGGEIFANSKGKTYEELWGEEKATEIKRKIGEASKGHVLSPEGRAKISKALKGKPKSPEHVAKMRGWEVPRETRKCQCSSKCEETFVCKVSSEQRFIQKHLNPFKMSPTLRLMDRHGEKAPTYGRKWMRNPNTGEVDSIQAKDVEQHKLDGWVFGRGTFSATHTDNLKNSHKGLVWIKNSTTGKTKMIRPEKLQQFLDSGWKEERGVFIRTY